LLSGTIYVAVIAQPQDDGSRQIVLEEFTKARPTSTSPGPRRPGPRRKPAAGASARIPKYVRKTPALNASLQADLSTMEVGVTIWRLRRGVDSDGGARVLVMENAQSSQWTPERIEAETPLRVGERVRITIESPRAGYLYVIDREQYADGSLGDAYLIFPTLRTRGGDNRVRPGRLVDIPAQEDTPSYFTLVPSPNRNDQVAEVLTIIVTPEPFDDLPLANNPVKLSRNDVSKWESSWSTQVERFEMVGGAGMSWTQSEKEASASASARLLTQEEPTPQTIYRIGSRNKKAFLVTVPLRYGR
jgi:hypothetical protein